MKADRNAGPKAHVGGRIDRGESPSAMEPLRLADGSRHRGELADLALELGGKSAGLRRALPAPIAQALARMVRAMNCYYSNLIEGHDTHPIDIERALQGDYSRDRGKRDLQLEAKAHIAVQEWIDEGGLASPPASVAAIRSIHERFCGSLPDDLLWVTDPATGERLKVVPGELRRRDVAVGNHRAVSPGALERFLERFEAGYAELGPSESMICLAAAHHRLLWIHPFLDGNGRVGRLLITLYLVSRGLLKRPVLYLSDFFERNRQLYYDNLTRVREKNDLLQWFKFFLVGVSETARGSIATFDDVLKLQKQTDQRLQELKSRSANAQKVVNALYKRPMTDAARVGKVTGVSAASAYKLIADLERLGILKEVTGSKRGRMYVFDAYLRLFK